MIENMPADGCLSVDCILLMYFCGVEVGLRGGGGGGWGGARWVKGLGVEVLDVPRIQ